MTRMKNSEIGGTKKYYALPTYALLSRLRIIPHLLLVCLLKEVEEEMGVRM